MDEVTAEELSEVLKPLGIILKDPRKCPTWYYELWTEDDQLQLAPCKVEDYVTSTCTWLCPKDVAKDLCKEENDSFAIIWSTTVKATIGDKFMGDKLMDNPFCGCKSLDEMRIISDLVGVQA